MTVHFIDHIVFVLIAAVFPIVDFFAVRKRAALIRSGRTELRMKFYRKIIWEEWVGTFVIATMWFVLGRGAAELGLIPGLSALAWAGYGLATLLCGLQLLQARSIIGKHENHVAFREQVGWMSFMVPHTARELRTFHVVSLTAGICEEIVFRGFVIAYLIALLGVPFWAAAVLSSIVFGLAHAYQGPIGFLRTAAVGGVMALLYGMTGSLWAPILVHIVIDMTFGRMSHAAFAGTTPENSSSLTPRFRRA